MITDRIFYIFIIISTKLYWLYVLDLELSWIEDVCCPLYRVAIVFRTSAFVGSTTDGTNFNIRVLAPLARATSTEHRSDAPVIISYHNKVNVYVYRTLR